MFSINDYVIYGCNGVCKVLDIGIPDLILADKKRQYYTLQQVYGNNSTIYTPIDNDKVLMRKVLSKKDATDLINNILSIETLDADDDKMLEEKYKEVMHKYTCSEWIKIIKTSYLRKEDRLAVGKKSKTADDKYLQMAEDYLYGELAIALNIEKNQVKNFIIQQIENINNSKVNQ